MKAHASVNGVNMCGYVRKCHINAHKKQNIDCKIVAIN
jgi:hypothetical protein